MKPLEAEVVVVGAGVAGLAAAARLAEGLDRVVVLEARERVGGRIWSHQPDGWPEPVELGAEFIHGGNPALESWLRIARIKSKPVADQHWLVERGRGVAMPDAWDRINAVMRRIGPRFRGSFAAWLQQSSATLTAADRVLASTFVEGFQGARLETMSARTLYRAAQEDESQSRPAGGYGKLTAALVARLAARGVSLRLRTVVSEVRWQRGAVELEAGNRTWRARAALIAVPLGVLRARPGERGAVRFSPRLVAREKGWRALGCGHAIRVVLRLRADVWRRGFVPAELRANAGRAFGFIHSDEPSFPVWWSRAPAPVLVGWAGGPAAERMMGWPRGRIYREARRSLARLLGAGEAQIERAVLGWETHDWAGDPFTRGAYSFSTAGQEDVPARLAAPVQDTLFFAGEATAGPLELGTVHGALASGERAADEIARALRTD